MHSTLRSTSVFRRITGPLCLVLAGIAASAAAQTPPGPPAYGPAIPLESARKVAAAALAEAQKNGWTMAVAITNTSGDLVFFEKMDDTQSASGQIAIEKSRSASMFKRPTKVFGDMLAAGNTYVLGLANANPVEGGLPLIANGKVIGAIGASGGTGAQDGIVAKAGAEQIR
ncbi:MULTISPECIES: GlcG/HbpS family heme-binding protein [Polaromonas]|uniref:Heme-binding protein n=1 Tax=Polaromonas aquatica TaxID=332657 RepID=A0ABW1TY31_9BURK